MAAIRGFHAHVYFDEATFEQARILCEQARDRFPVRMGRMHRKPVGPHPCWSCQLAFEPPAFGDVVPWLALHRNGLVVFVHPETGDEIADHVTHAMWMGAVKELDLDALE
jgi:DOPA 4,5-dioxygenase